MFGFVYIEMIRREEWREGRLRLGKIEVEKRL